MKGSIWTMVSDLFEIISMKDREPTYRTDAKIRLPQSRIVVANHVASPCDIESVSPKQKYFHFKEIF